MFYGEQKPFSVEYLINPDPLNDKVFNTFEYRLNDQFIDWNHLEVSNWYQYGELNDGAGSSVLTFASVYFNFRFPKGQFVKGQTYSETITLTLSY